MLTRRKFLYAMPFIPVVIKSIVYADYDAKTILDSIIDSQSNWDEKSAKSNARTIIEYSAGISNDDEMKKFLGKMKNLTDIMADKNYGNRNAVPEKNEINDMRKKNIGIEGLYKLYGEYGL